MENWTSKKVNKDRPRCKQNDEIRKYLKQMGQEELSRDRKKWRKRSQKRITNLSRKLNLDTGVNR